MAIEGQIFCQNNQVDFLSMIVSIFLIYITKEPKPKCVLRLTSFAFFFFVCCFFQLPRSREIVGQCCLNVGMDGKSFLEQKRCFWELINLLAYLRIVK